MIYINCLIDDPALRDRMGQAGLEFVQTTFNWETITDRLEEVYYDLCSQIRNPEGQSLPGVNPSPGRQWQHAG